LIANWFTEYAILRQLKHLVFAVKAFRPDVIVGSMFTLGMVALRLSSSIPITVLGQCTYLYAAPEGQADQLSHELYTRREWRRRDVAEHLRRALKVLGVSTEALDIESRLNGDLFLLRSIPDLEGDISSLPPTVHFAGDCLWDLDEPDPELEAWLAESKTRSRQVIYVQQAKIFDLPSFWPDMVESLRNSDMSIVASTGRMAHCPTALPSNFYVRPHLPQKRVMEQASVVLCSGTTTPVLGAITHGVPLVMIPTGGEQPDAAEICCQAGVAVELNADGLTAEQISNAIRSVDGNEAMRERARHLARQFNAMRSIDPAVSLLQRLAKSQLPMQRDALQFV